MNQFGDAFNKHEALEAKGMGEWIDVKKELPPQGKEVIIVSSLRKVTSGWRRSLGEDYTGRAARWHTGIYPTNDVTHWMPLPAPPKEPR